jgi:aspartate aminotransferase
LADIVLAVWEIEEIRKERLMRLAKRMMRLGTETAFEVLAKAKALEAQGRDIVHLEIGEPDFDTPANIIKAGVKAMNNGYTHYSPAAGLPVLRKTVAQEFAKTHGVETPENNVVIVSGGKPIIFYSLLVLCEEGDEVIYPNPGFPIYESMIKYAGAKPVPLKLSMDRQFGFDPQELISLVNERTRLIILNSPANPTGGVLAAEDLQAISRCVLAHDDLFVLSDEIYSRILYGGNFSSIASIPGMAERTIVLDGFSKTYAMTGWRLGYGLMPEKLAEHFIRLIINSNSCTAGFIQMAGVEALTGPQDSVTKMVGAFRERRDLIVDGLSHIPGFKCLKPLGAFYVFPSIAGTGVPSRQMAGYLMEKAGVAVLSGTSFGANGEGFIRLSYANSLENIKKALDRINDAVIKL